MSTAATSFETAPPKAPAYRGVASGEADLWCTYAAVRTLGWLGRISDITDLEGTADYLSSRRNTDGGYAWSKGMLSDAWATFYCTQALTDLGRPVPALDRTADWLRRTWSGDAFAMLPGQTPDVWATHFSTRTAIDTCGIPIPDADRLLTWLGALQTADGGLGWSPGHAATGNADVRACQYGVAAWQTLASASDTSVSVPRNVSALIDWLRAQQTECGGFRFSPDADLPCLWATYRATAALRALGSGPARPVEDWIVHLRGPSGGFVRWPGYDVEDVWASFCAVGSLRAIGVHPSSVAEPVVRRLAELACPGGGYTYREPERAADVLSTAAAVLSAPAGDPVKAELRGWLEGCQLPNEGGLMYMPARGSEIRCTLWGLAASAFLTDPPARHRIAEWLPSLQNPDGGFGCWEGRGSELSSTSAAVEIVRLLGQPIESRLDTGALASFLRSCKQVDELAYGMVPGAEPSLRAALQALRVWHALHLPVTANQLNALLRRHAVRGGGYANVGSRMPDLLSTYEAVVTADLHGVRLDRQHLGRFLDRVSLASGTAWSPLAPADGGPLADCLGVLLRRWLSGQPIRLPALTLS